jgi:hypothetical protein
MSLPQRRVVVLVVAGLVGVFAVLPHPIDHLAEFIGSGVLLAIAAVAGTRFGPRVGLSTPIIDAALSRQRFLGGALTIAVVAIGIGFIVTIAAIALDLVVFAPLLAQAQVAPLKSAPPFWTGVLYALYGGLAEETVVHYGALSLLVWLFAKISRGPGAYWIAIVVAAVLLGIGHVASTAAFLPLTPVVVTRVITLNVVAGVPLGWLYWRRGLESAMVAHGVADLLLHVAMPGVLG